MSIEPKCDHAVPISKEAPIPKMRRIPQTLISNQSSSDGGLTDVWNVIFSHLDLKSIFPLRESSKDFYKLTTSHIINIINNYQLDLHIKVKSIELKLSVFSSHVRALQVLDITSEPLTIKRYRALKICVNIKHLAAQVKVFPNDGFAAFPQLEALTILIDSKPRFKKLNTPNLKELKFINLHPLTDKSTEEFSQKILNSIECSSIYFKNGFEVEKKAQDMNRHVDGRACLTLPNQKEFFGYFINSKPNGLCEVTSYAKNVKQSIYRGNVLNGQLHSSIHQTDQEYPSKTLSMMFFKSGAIFTGYFDSDHPVGSGVIQFNDGAQFIGDFNGFKACTGTLFLKGGQENITDVFEMTL